MRVFVTGATGYLGRPLCEALLARGHAVRALARAESALRVVPGCEVVVGNALDAASYAHAVAGCDAFVHLIGVAHPGPGKAAQFIEVDLASVEAALAAATAARVRHFVYVSVAQPAPVMRAYVDARRRAEGLIRAAALDATVLRPWYVLGPGHRWPYALLPLWWFAGWLPGVGETVRRLGFVRLREMVAALVTVVEAPARGVRVMDVAAIRGARIASCGKERGGQFAR